MFVRFLSHRLVQIAILLVLLAASVYVRQSKPPWLVRAQHLVFDTYNKVMPRVPQTDHVAILDIDEESLDQVGQWPWPRTQVADLVTALTDMGAKVIAFDMVFAEHDRTSPDVVLGQLKQDTMLSDDAREVINALPNNDEYFANSFKQSGRVVTGFAWTNKGSLRTPVLKPLKIFNTGENPDPIAFAMPSQHYATNLPMLSKSAAGNGSFGVIPEGDGIIRRVPLVVSHTPEGGDKATLYPALAVEALRVAQNKRVIKVRSYGEPTPEGFGITEVEVGEYTIPTDQRGRIWMHYSGNRPDMYIPAWHVLSGQLDPERVKDRIVFVGTSAIGLLDLRSTPLNPVLPGVQVHAEIVEQVLDGAFLNRPQFFDQVELLAILSAGFIAIFLVPFVSIATSAVLVVFLVFAGILASLYAYQTYGYLVDPLYPGLTITTLFIVSSILSNLRSEAERRMIKNAFGHYISQDLMAELTSDPDKLRLGGEVRELSVMFTDVRNFTTISEAMTPAEVIQMMNDFLTPMTSIVMEERGTVDKYMGDAMMAFWNAPLDVPDHAKHACRAALRMAEALEPINVEAKARAEKEGRDYHEIRTGIGVATGPCSVGNMGSKQRFAYSALGDTVNLASRIEGQTKPYGVPVMVPESTAHAAEGFAFLELDLIRVKGKVEPERIFALVGLEDVAQSDAFATHKEKHDDMLALYRAGEFKKAANKCRDLKKAECAAEIAGYYDLMNSRCKAYEKTPPKKGWGGVFIALEK